jgi:hypothetical protein
MSTRLGPYEWGDRGGELSGEFINAVPLSSMSIFQLQDFKAALSKVHDLEDKVIQLEKETQ